MSYEILVTGGAGYIGSILVPTLIERGHRVTVLDNFFFRQNSLASVCYHSNFRVVNGDIRDERIMEHLAGEADIIIPLASLVGAPLCSKDPVGATSINRDAQMRMFGRLSKNQRVLMPTTNSAYGVGEVGKMCTETSPLKPISLYAKDKVEVEKSLMERENSISFRLATVFGMSPRMRIDLLVNDFVYRAVHDRFVVLFESHFKRNYIHIRDVVKVFIHGIDRFDTMRGEIYNVGLSDANLSKYELCQRIQKKLPSFVFLEANVGQDPDKRDYIVSNEKIERSQFRPDFSLEMGIDELVKGFQMIKNTQYGNV